MKKTDGNTIEETDLRRGSVITVCRTIVDRDGKKMRITVEDKLHKATISRTANKL